MAIKANMKETKNVKLEAEGTLVIEDGELMLATISPDGEILEFLTLKEALEENGFLDKDVKSTVALPKDELVVAVEAELV